MENRYQEHIMKTLRKRLGLEADDTSRDEFINTYSPSEVLDTIETEDDTYEEEWEDDSDRSCKDCPPSECNGHCMSCYYRSV